VAHLEVKKGTLLTDNCTPIIYRVREVNEHGLVKLGTSKEWQTIPTTWSIYNEQH